MDYDDSEFQSQGFQLIGEDSNKFPSSLQSFALPRIDIDEQFHSHLRFDNLADTNVYLSIQGQDNNWIEDFSSGITAIEFSSTAAESCSITRQNNVWSEATSSESVEMLLKSVADDEMIDRKSSIMEGDAHDGLIGKSNVDVDIILKQDGDHDMKKGDISENNPETTPDKCPSNISIVDEDATGVQTLVEGNTGPNDSYYTNYTGTQGDLSSSYGNLDAGPGKSTDPSLPDQVPKDDTQIITSERNNLLCDDGQRETNDVIRKDGAMNKEYSEQWQAMSHLSGGKGPFLTPLKDSVLVGHGSNESGYSANSDGLLEAIAYPVKALSKDIESSDKNSAALAEGTSSQMQEGDKVNEIQNAEVGNKNFPILPQPGSNSKDVCYIQPDTGIKVDYSIVEMPIPSAMMLENPGEEQLDSVLKETGEERSSKCHLSEASASDIGGPPEMVLEACATVSMGYETQINEVKDDYSLENCKSENPESAVAKNRFEDEVTDDLEAEGNASGAKSNDSHLPSSLSDAEVTITATTDSVGKNNLVPSTCPDASSINNNGNDVFMEKAADIPSAGENDIPSAGENANVSVLTDPLAKILEEESVIQHSPPEVSTTVDAVVDQKATILDAHLADDVAEITNTCFPLKEKLQNEPDIKSACFDHQSQDNISVAKKDEANSRPHLSELGNSYKEIVTSSSVSLSHSEGNLVSQVSSRSIADPNIGDHGTLDSRIEPQHSVDEQALVHVDNVDGSSKKESHQMRNKLSSGEGTVAVEGDPFVGRSASTDKDASDSPAVSTPTNKEILVHVTGGDQSRIKDESASTLSRNNIEAYLEADSDKPTSMQGNCGSPTIISCREQPQGQEGSTVLSDQTGIVTSDVPSVASDKGRNCEEVQSFDKELEVIATPEQDRSFTFVVGSLADSSVKDAGSEWKPFASMQSSGAPKASKGKSRGSHTQDKEGKQHAVRKKTPNADNSSRVTMSSNESLMSPKGKSAKKAPITKTPDIISCSVSSFGAVSKDVQLEGLKCNDSKKTKTSHSPVIQKSGLPDLNSSLATSSFYQPFTDLQQVQLRAQIFVYGSLIQGISPLESCMVSAFGGTDGERSSWEGAWRLSVEKSQNQKSPSVNSESRHPDSPAVVPEQASSSSLKSKSFNVKSQKSTKLVPLALQGSSTPLTSPVWSFSTHDVLKTSAPRGMNLDFNQASSPLHSYYSSQGRQFSAKGSPLPFQIPHAGPRGIPVKALTPNAAPQYSTVPVVEAVQVTPVRDSSAQRAPIIQVVPPSALLPTPSPLSSTAPSLVNNESQRKTASPVVNKKMSNNPKPRKRKRPAGAEDLESTPVVQCTTESASAAIVKDVPNIAPVSSGLVSSSSMPAKGDSGNLQSTTPSMFTANFPLISNTPAKQTAGNLQISTSKIFPDCHPIIGNTITEQRTGCLQSTALNIFADRSKTPSTTAIVPRAFNLEETSSRIEQAKLQAEQAASLAAASIRHSQDIWSQLTTRKDSGLISEDEAKLAAAAAAAAAAASVAKAAAAAARIASEAALQAKMMADEILGLSKTGKLTHIPDTDLDTVKKLGRLTPDSILKGRANIDGSSSVISAAREAARRRVEAASAATKRAENIDAILKAAELAAEAVSQAGAIIAMGDPLPFKLSELVDAGPGSFWKVQRSNTEKHDSNKLLETENMGFERNDHDHLVVKQSDGNPLNITDIPKAATEHEVSNIEQSVTSTGNCQGGLVTDTTIQIDRHQSDHLSTNVIEKDIQKGSFVEVVSNDDELKGGWFSAHVLELKDKKAYVCYVFLNDKDSVQLKEWVSLEAEGYTAPRIRIAHPLTTLKHEVTGKRSREAIENHVWAVGDRVDAWMRNGWWEGIVTGKSQGDETKLTVQFPARGDSSVVRAWNLRPSLVWKDGQWMEWSRARENTHRLHHAPKGDTPPEKRRKFDTDKLSGKVPFKDPGKPEESQPLNLSARDQIFSIGRDVQEESKSDALQVKRTGLQKEKSKVIFGVPKPGKKKKFMDVSKHYLPDNKTDKTSGTNDSYKFAKYLMPQQTRTWKTTSRVEPKKQAAESSKNRGMRSVNSQTVQTRSTAEKDNSSVSTTSVSSTGDNGRGALRKPRAGISENSSLEKKAGLVVKAPGIPTTKKKSAAEGNSKKEKPTSVSDKPTRSEDKGDDSPKELMPDSTEPRRSNRRIQPTSRLLEGIQSSLIISKMPSYDKPARLKHRGSSSRGSSRV